MTLLAGMALCLSGCDPQAAQRAAEEAAQQAAKEAAEQTAAAEKEAQEAASKAGEALKEAEAAAVGAVKQAEGTAAELGGKAEGAIGTLGQELGAATQKASEALKGVEGGSELLTKINALFASASTTIASATDEATAQAAAPKLGELALTAEGLKPLLEKLPPEAKTAVASVIEKGIPQLQTILNTAYAIPGVEAALKPKVDELLAKLTALAGKPPA
jgi:hypothetical protein